MIWSKEEVKFLKSNYKNLSYGSIGDILGRSYKSVSRKAANLGLRKKLNKSWFDFEIAYIRKYYDKIPPVKLAKNLNRTYSSVTLKAMNLGLSVGYRYFEPIYNEEFFDVWSNELAWLVGIVLSDGHVSDVKNSKFVRIKMCDRDVVAKIKDITRYEKDLLIHYSDNSKYKTAYSISFHGEKVWQFFTDLGMDNKKSSTAVFPEVVPEEYIYHVIRGVFDGDGAVYLSKNTNYPFARVCGTSNVVGFIKNYMGLYCTKHYNSDINVTIQYTGKNAVEFLNKIYFDSNKFTRMSRKYNKYLKIVGGD